MQNRTFDEDGFLYRSGGNEAENIRDISTVFRRRQNRKALNFSISKNSFCSVFFNFSDSFSGKQSFFERRKKNIAFFKEICYTVPI